METLGAALALVTSGDPAFLAIVGLSLRVSLTAVLCAALIGAPLGAVLALWRFAGRGLLVLITTSFMALPPVFVGLLVYLTLSRSGPLGELGLLFTPQAMVIAQTILIAPIIAALTREAILPLARDYEELPTAHDVPQLMRLEILLWDARYGIVTALLAGFGRAIAEVGAVIVVGGNINGVTRVMTTTIALETSKGNIELAVALGLVLIGIAFFINALVHLVARAGRRHQVRA